MASACGKTCDGTCGWCRLTAERDALKAEVARLQNEVASRNKRAIEGDEAAKALEAVHKHYEGIEADNKRLREALERYASHRGNCGIYLEANRCTCGLDDALGQIGEKEEHK
jgi:hypothetical protein